MSKTTFLLLLVLMVLPGFGCSSTCSECIRVAAASSLRPLLDPLVEAYQDQGGYEVEVIYGSSGSLANRIINGAPYHAYFPASAKFADEVAWGLETNHIPQRICKARLAVVYTESQEFLGYWFPPTIKHFSIPNPKAAPVGAAASEWLESHPLPDGAQLIQASNAAGTISHITEGGAEAGITAAPLVIGQLPKEQVRWIPEEDLPLSALPTYYYHELSAIPALRDFRTFMDRWMAEVGLGEMGYLR